MCKDIQYQIRRWLLDEEDAFREIFAYYYPRLYRYAFRYLKSEVLAEDLSMEVLTRVWEKRASITQPITFENYLFTAARNRLINHWQRKIEGLLSLETMQAGQTGDRVGNAVQSDDPVLSKELEAIYQTSLSELPAQRRLVFHLHRNEQLSYKEIANKLNISPRTVENHMGAALKQLRVALSQYLSSIILIFMTGL
jgi:RNA polymerase sigma-70 factor (ECF subfamily)